MLETGASQDQLAAMRQVETKLRTMLGEGFSTYDLLQDVLTHHPEVLDELM